MMKNKIFAIIIFMLLLMNLFAVFVDAQAGQSTLSEGGKSTFTFNDTVYEVTFVRFLSDEQKAVFNVNGQNTNALSVGQEYKFADGSVLKVLGVDSIKRVVSFVIITKQEQQTSAAQAPPIQIQPTMQIKPLTTGDVTETIKCVFVNSNKEEQCWSSKQTSCSGIETCMATIQGKLGEQVTWKSTCGGYAYTTIGQDKYAEFKCTPLEIPTLTSAPVMEEINTLSCGMKAFNRYNECPFNGGYNTGFRKISVQCLDGTEFKEGGETSCKLADDWQRIGGEFCSRHCVTSKKTRIMTAEEQIDRKCELEAEVIERKCTDNKKTDGYDEDDEEDSEEYNEEECEKEAMKFFDECKAKYETKTRTMPIKFPAGITGDQCSSICVTHTDVDHCITIGKPKEECYAQIVQPCINQCIQFVKKQPSQPSIKDCYSKCSVNYVGCVRVSRIDVSRKSESDNVCAPVLWGCMEQCTQTQIAPVEKKCRAECLIDLNVSNCIQTKSFDECTQVIESCLNVCRYGISAAKCESEEAFTKVQIECIDEAVRDIYNTKNREIFEVCRNAIKDAACDEAYMLSSMMRCVEEKLPQVREIVKRCVPATSKIQPTVPPPSISPVSSPQPKPLCNGCEINDRCLPFGTRVVDNVPSYCDVDKSINTQKKDETLCQNNYECASNTCTNGICNNPAEKIAKLEKELQEHRTILQKIMNFFSSWFK